MAAVTKPEVARACGKTGVGVGGLVTGSQGCQSVLDGYSGKTQHEVQEGLNVVENWNATNDFICYGSPGRTGYQQP